MKIKRVDNKINTALQRITFYHTGYYNLSIDFSSINAAIGIYVL